ncbi:MAG: hypothetical protein H7343_12030 [Undibacterium sp.]|nr:hypothetical protein [Opitutaceae bacterium]
MRAPPHLPEETLYRVLRLARFNGMSVLAIAGFFSLLSAAGHDVPGAIVGVLVAGAGAFELHGVGLLRQGDTRGTTWLVSSQLYLLVVVLAYVGFRLTHIDLEQLRLLITEEQRETISMSGLSEDQFLRVIYTTSSAVFGIVTLFYQGGMAFYYHRRRAAIAQALAEPPETPRD